MKWSNENPSYCSCYDFVYINKYLRQGWHDLFGGIFFPSLNYINLWINVNCVWCMFFWHPYGVLVGMNDEYTHRHTYRQPLLIFITFSVIGKLSRIVGNSNNLCVVSLRRVRYTILVLAFHTHVILVCSPYTSFNPSNLFYSIPIREN